MPLCKACQKHLKEANATYLTGVIYWAITLLVPCIVYGVLIVKYDREIASAFGVGSTMGFLPILGISLAVMALLGVFLFRRWDDKSNRGAHWLGSNCATSQGRIKYVRYICPTPVTPGVEHSQHFFVVTSDDYLKEFLAANGGDSFIATEFDEHELWERTLS